MRGAEPAKSFPGSVAPLLATMLLVSIVRAGETSGIEAPNVVVVSPTLVTAGQPTSGSLQRLKAQGFVAVISLAPGDTADAVVDEAQILGNQGIEFIHVPIPWQAPQESHYLATAAALRRLEGSKVLVHCQKNMRASAITFLYRVIERKEDPAIAWRDVKSVWTPKDQWAAFVDQQLRRHRVSFSPE